MTTVLCILTCHHASLNHSVVIIFQYSESEIFVLLMSGNFFSKWIMWPTALESSRCPHGNLSWICQIMPEHYNHLENNPSFSCSVSNPIKVNWQSQQNLPLFMKKKITSERNNFQSSVKQKCFQSFSNLIEKDSKSWAWSLLTCCKRTVYSQWD